MCPVWRSKGRRPWKPGRWVMTPLLLLLLKETGGRGEEEEEEQRNTKAHQSFHGTLEGAINFLSKGGVESEGSLGSYYFLSLVNGISVSCVKFISPSHFLAWCLCVCLHMCNMFLTWPAAVSGAEDHSPYTFILQIMHAAHFHLLAPIDILCRSLPKCPTRQPPL